MCVLYLMTTLPDLPRILAKKEASVTPAILKWIRENGPPSFLFEIKVCRGKSLPASAVLPHQKLALLAASGGGIVHKISDEARRKQPADGFKISFARGYVFVAFLKESPRKVVVIDIKKLPARITADSPSDFSFTL